MQLAQSAIAQQSELAIDLNSMRRQLNDTDAVINAINTAIDDATATASQVMTSAQSVQQNISAVMAGVVDSGAALQRLMQLQLDVINVDNQVLVCCFFQFCPNQLFCC